jgi:hypothetical protein
MCNFSETQKQQKTGNWHCGISFVNGFCVARTRGTTRRTQRFERRGLYARDLGLQRNTVTEASRRQNAQRTTERDTEPYPGSGPSFVR